MKKNDYTLTIVISMRTAPEGDRRDLLNALASHFKEIEPWHRIQWIGIDHIGRSIDDLMHLIAGEYALMVVGGNWLLSNMNFMPVVGTAIGFLDRESAIGAVLLGDAPGGFTSLLSWYLVASGRVPNADPPPILVRLSNLMATRVHVESSPPVDCLRPSVPQGIASSLLECNALRLFYHRGTNPWPVEPPPEIIRKTFHAIPTRGRNFSIQIISNRPNLAAATSESLSPLESFHFNGAGYPSFSALVNSAVAAAPHDLVIIASDKVRPAPWDVYRLIALLNAGFCFVGLYRFAFFGFSKALFKKIGCLDERFLGGQYEDDDFILRMREANIAYYLTKEVPYLRMPSSWNSEKSSAHFLAKWGFFELKCTSRRLQEESCGYNFGPAKISRYLPGKFSVGIAENPPYLPGNL